MKNSLRAALLSLNLVFVSVLGHALPAYAQDAAKAAPTAASIQAALATPQGKFINNLGKNAITIMADKTISAQMRSEKFREILRQSFDLPTIGRFVIGRSWNSASPAQQQDYMNLFEKLVVKTYGDRMSLYTGEGFEVVGVRPETERDTVVLSHITHPDGSAPTEVDWRVRQRDGALGIIDVVVEGVSLSVTQRQEYSAVIQRNDGKIDALLDLMRQQIDQAGMAKKASTQG